MRSSLQSLCISALALAAKTHGFAIPDQGTTTTTTTLTTKTLSPSSSVPSSSSSSIFSNSSVPVSVSTSISTVLQTIFVTQTQTIDVAQCAATGGTSTGSDGSSGSSGSSSSSSPVTGPTLLPAVHWEYPVDDIRNLAPVNSASLYYSQNGVSDPTVEHLFASLNVTLQQNTVILDHSSFVSGTTCSANGIEVTFTSIEALNYASSTWSVSEFVLVTYTDGCGSTNEQRTFWQATSISVQVSSNSILVSISEEIAIEDAFQEVELVYGVYTPSGQSSTIGTLGGSGSSSGGSGSGGSGGSNGGSGGSGSSGSSGSGSTSSGSSGSGSGSSGSGSGSASGTSGSGAAIPTAASDSGSACGNAPGPTVDGFPAANCGDPNFDLDIDNAIGYLDFSSGDYSASIQDFVPDVGFDSDDLTDDDGSDGDDSILNERALRRRALHKRNWFTSAISKVASVVVKVATAPVQLVQAAVKAIPVVGDAIAKATTLTPSVTGNADIKLGPDNSATSPWGPAALIYTKASSDSSKVQADLNLYCVNCGLSGHITLYGSAKFDILNGLSALNANINANLVAGLNIGLDATATFSDTKTKQLIRQAIPDLGLAIKGVFSAGCFVGVDATATLDIKAQGQALVGVTMSFPNFQANLNLIDANGAQGSSVTGYTPQFQKTFEASGQISATATLSLPISLNVGVEIPAIKFSKTLALIEQPGVTGTVTYSGSTAGAAPASDTCNNGLEYSVSVQNDINFDFFGVKTFNLNHLEQQILSGCKSLGSNPSSTVTSSTTTAATDTGSAPTSTDTNSATDTGSSPTSTDATATDTSVPTSTDDTSPTSTDDSTSPTETDVTPTSTDDSTPTSTDDSTTPTSTDDGTATATDDSTEPTDTPVGKLLRRQSDNSTSTDDDGDAIDDPSGDEDIENDETDSFGSDSDDTADQGDGAVDNDDSDPDNAEYQDDSTAAMSDADDSASMANFTYTTIQDLQNTFSIVPGEDGNLYASAVEGVDDGASLFGLQDDVVAMDDDLRTLYYYPDVMSAFNASRIRLGNETHLPKTADFIAFKPVNYDDDSSTANPLFAVDSAGDAYLTVLCNFSNGAASKLFLISDETGLDALQSTQLTYIVTGATVSQCEVVTLTYGTSDQ